MYINAENSKIIVFRKENFENFFWSKNNFCFANFFQIKIKYINNLKMRTLILQKQKKINQFKIIIGQSLFGKFVSQCFLVIFEVYPRIDPK